ncbi:Fanconi anemia group J protein [Trichoplax sp. H2]|nr:Fanconi anemia group J protein [Trichoplax sp. H2]|eukprot:RDD47463.1 Fanconi anemia group J protein [Trichoplax sp. H2]
MNNLNDVKTSVTNIDNNRSYTISGVQVEFPYKAYPSQLSMMSKIIQGLQQRKHCLLESPTGSEKCRQEYLLEMLEEKEELKAFDASTTEEYIALIAYLTVGNICNLRKITSLVTSCNTESNTTSNTAELENKDLSKSKERKTSSTCISDKIGHGIENFSGVQKHIQLDLTRDIDDEDDFMPDKKRFRPPTDSRKGRKAKKNSNKDPSTQAITSVFERVPTCSQNLLDDKAQSQVEASTATEITSSSKKSIPKSYTPSVPKIFFGTRTHKQIAQIIRELKKTAYRNVKMTILSSRDFTCIHPKISKSSSKNDDCRLAIEVGSCVYHHNVPRLKSHQALEARGINSAWDIEEFVQVCNKSKACPYYAARGLIDQSEIIFCPYNYLIESSIRDLMDITLRNQIVILDEAHNIEDSAREATSFEITALTLKEMIDDLNFLIERDILTGHHGPIHAMCHKLWLWINDESHSLKNTGFEQASKVWSAIEILAIFERMDISVETYPTIQHHVNKIAEYEHAEYSKKIETGVVLAASGKTLLYLKGMMLVFGYLLRTDKKYCTDYKITLVKSVVNIPVEATQGRRRWRTGQTRKQWTYSLNFWCMNPAVAFDDIGPAAHSVILTSGTLSPMNSFSSELGLAFSIRLEAAHIINYSQALVATLSEGINGVSLNASYRSAETFAFQDELGNIILEACRIIPGGILCFFPSYNLLDKVVKRWQYDKVIRECLITLDFDDLLQKFYGSVSNSNAALNMMSGPSGGLFLAVCRGKVSEGLDFADDNARAVITVGIPYPNIKDLKIELKKKYNDKFSAQRNLLTGKEWYEIQAYRALNQALGRCIRNRNDWGALLLLDDRFGKSTKYTAGLAKWVRQRVQHFSLASDTLATLSSFVSGRIDSCETPLSSNTQESVSKYLTPEKKMSILTSPECTKSPLMVDLSSPVSKPNLNLCTGFVSARKLVAETICSNTCKSRQDDDIHLLSSPNSEKYHSQTMITTDKIINDDDNVINVIDSSFHVGANISINNKELCLAPANDISSQASGSSSLFSCNSSSTGTMTPESENVNIEQFSDSENELILETAGPVSRTSQTLMNEKHKINKCCITCGSLLLKESDSGEDIQECSCELVFIEVVRKMHLEFLCSIGRKIDKDLRISSTNVYKCGKECIAANGKLLSQNTEPGMYWLNSYYSEVDNKVYVPIYCIICKQNYSSTCCPTIGFMEVNVTGNEYQAYLLQEALQ